MGGHIGSVGGSIKARKKQVFQAAEGIGCLTFRAFEHRGFGLEGKPQPRPQTCFPERV